MAAAGSDAENTRSVAPAEKQKPARNPVMTVMYVMIPYSNAYTTYSTGERNMKANSNGSVTPQTKLQIAQERRIPIVAFLRVVFALRIIARAAPGIPNIMHGKKPDIYMPSDQVTSALVFPAQKAVRSPSPIVSNQKTLFSA